MTVPRSSSAASIAFETLPGVESPSEELEALRAALAEAPPRLPARYFYDELGSRLFEEICDQPEYYQTRTEGALLEAYADEILERSAANELVELGSGDGRKTRVLLAAMIEGGPGLYVPFEVSEEIARRSAQALVEEFPGLAVHGILGDFTRELGHLPAAVERDGQPGRRLAIFLGGTIGNFGPAAAHEFLRRLHAELEPGDSFLLGTDLVKDRARLEAAYNDARGLTAAFNRNILDVVNRVADANFDSTAFEHRAVFEPRAARIEMWLLASRPQRVQVAALGVELEFAAGQGILSEISRKFTRASAAEMLRAAGFEPELWISDQREDFGLTLARRL